MARHCKTRAKAKGVGPFTHLDTARAGLIGKACLVESETVKERGELMPLLPNQIYQCENTIGTNTRYSGGTATLAAMDEGICVAQSALFCLNMKEGKKDLLTKPDTGRASILQAKYDMDPDPENTVRSKLFAELDFTVAPKVKLPGMQALQHLIKNNGLYFMRYKGHAMAAKIGDGAYYYFEPEEGLFKFKSGGDLEKEVMKRYVNKMKENWYLFKLS
jgi:hypothetical protein